MDIELVAPLAATAGADPAQQQQQQQQQQHLLSRPCLPKARSLSDGGGTTPRLFPSPHIVESAPRTSKDDHYLHTAASANTTAANASLATLTALPSTPKRSAAHGLSPLHVQHHHHHPPQVMQQQQQQLHFSPRTSRQFTPPPPVAISGKPAPLSPKLDHSHIYASPTNILPRRSRGLEFSRAATSLHHTTLAESSPESSPTVGGGRGINIPAARSSDYSLTAGNALQSSASASASASAWPPGPSPHERAAAISSSIGSSQAVGSDSSTSSDDVDLMDEDMDEAFFTTPRIYRTGGPSAGAGSFFGSPAMATLASFQNRQRPRKHPKKKVRGPLGLGFNMAPSSLSRSPPVNSTGARRESISWQANQLHISGADGEDSVKSPSDVDGPSTDTQPNVTHRAVTRRGNLLPKTKTFARIRVALMEEGAPAEAECRREAEVVKQVRESDIDQEARPQTNTFHLNQAVSALSSPNMVNQDSTDELDEDLMRDLSTGLAGSFKQQLLKNRSKSFWDTYSECSSNGGGTRASPPPMPFMPRGSLSGFSDDNALDSPLIFPLSYTQSSQGTAIGPQPPSATEISRRIHNKRRRDDDFDPVSFKRRAVSPGMSVHNSPIVQSPMQRDNAAWGSRPGSTGGDRAGSSVQSDSGSLGGGGGGGGRMNGNKGRIGFQGMVDANDAIMRMSIE